MKHMDNNQMISALADGELESPACAGVLEALSQQAEARQAWQMYHLIGDVLRSSELAHATPSAVFLGRLSERLAAEPAPLAHVSHTMASDAAHGDAAADSTVQAHRAEPANDSSFRWKLAAGFASAAAIAAVGWTLAGGALLSPAQPQLARAPGLPSSSQVLASSPRGTMIRDARLDELLAAHRQLGGDTALQAPAGFLQNATFDSPAR
jgi:sigma-E factor negative regulatory protein RseA